MHLPSLIIKTGLPPHASQGVMERVNTECKGKMFLLGTYKEAGGDPLPKEETWKNVSLHLH